MKKALYVVAGLALLALLAWIAFGYVGSNRSDFPGPVETGKPLPGILISELERYVTETMEENAVPGVSMVLAQGDKVVYSRSIGVRDLVTNAPVNTQTLFGIGSTTKSMTAVMIGSLVDEGLIAWDTPVVDIMPTFALSDPETTRAITVEDMLCMCTGVPRRMEDITVRYRDMTAESITESLAAIPLSGVFRQQFNYSSRMLAVGGYMASMAAGGEYGGLYHAYTYLMQERLLDPVGMTMSTFSIDEAVSTGNYATPHYSALSGIKAIPAEIEGMMRPIAPAGAMWSNADDMGKYLVMLLKQGASANGHRVVSEGNLAYQWEPRVAIDTQIGYGLGWHTEDYRGLKVVHHPGGTAGFASELVVIPEYGVGFALLTNSLDMVKPIGRMATYRLLEMLTGNEQTYDYETRKAAKSIGWQMLLLSIITKEKADPDELAPYLGTYHNDSLGEVALLMHEDRSLWIDFGEYESEIRPMILQKNQFIFFESVFIGKTLTLATDPDGHATVRWPGDEDVYNFAKLVQ